MAGWLGNVEGEEAPSKTDALRPRKSSVASFINASSDKRIRRQEDKKESAYENNRLSKPEGKGVRKPKPWF
jgi:hypothetical protein